MLSLSLPRPGAPLSVHVVNGAFATPALIETSCSWGVLGRFCRTDTCASAAFGGRLSLLQWARAAGCPWDEKTCSTAADGGHLDVLVWSRENGCPWNEGEC